jgi:hypothetical protein
MYRVAYYGYQCPCGAKPSGVRVGISSLAALVVEWVCNNCKANCLVAKPLMELVADMPVHPFTELTDTDKELMKGLKISV